MKQKITIEIDEVVNATVYPYHMYIRIEKNGIVVAENKGYLFASLLARGIIEFIMVHAGKINMGK
jgi:hypothetical protein